MHYNIVVIEVINFVYNYDIYHNNLPKTAYNFAMKNSIVL